MVNKLRIGKIIMTDSLVLTDEMLKGDYTSGQKALEAYEKQGGWPAITTKAGTDDDQIDWITRLLEMGRPDIIVRGVKLFRVSEKCKNCSMCSKVDTNISGSPMEPNEYYYQCLSGVESDCLGEDYVTGCYTNWGVVDIQSKNCFKCINCVAGICVKTKNKIADSKCAEICPDYVDKKEAE